MRITRLARFLLVACAALIGCRTSVVGHYQLDLDETKRCVEKAAAENPDDAHMKDGTIKMLEATRVDVELQEGGKMTSTTVLENGTAPTTQKRDGTWRLDGKRVTIKIYGESDTSCDVDGKRLRCQKDVLYKLFGHYVLVRS